MMDWGWLDHSCVINSFFLVALTMFPKFSEFRLPKTNLSTLCHALLAPKKIKDTNVSIRKIEHEKCVSLWLHGTLGPYTSHFNWPFYIWERWKWSHFSTLVSYSKGEKYFGIICKLLPYVTWTARRYLIFCILKFDMLHLKFIYLENLRLLL